jgi:hypothetical protein
MTNQHPITPPPDLVQQWREESSTGELHFSPQYLATRAARWGADQELDACCSEVAWLESTSMAKKIRDRRRPKPPSLKEEALEALEEIGQVGSALVRSRSDTIRRALESIND